MLTPLHSLIVRECVRLTASVEQEVVVPCLKRDTPSPFKLHRLPGKEIKYKSTDRVQSNVEAA